MALKMLIGIARTQELTSALLSRIQPLAFSLVSQQSLHTTRTNFKIEKWSDQNEWVYPPQKPGEPRRPAVSNGKLFHWSKNSKFKKKLKIKYICAKIKKLLFYTPNMQFFCCHSSFTSF